MNYTKFGWNIFACQFRPHIDPTKKNTLKFNEFTTKNCAERKNSNEQFVFIDMTQKGEKTVKKKY